MGFNDGYFIIDHGYIFFNHVIEKYIWNVETFCRH